MVTSRPERPSHEEVGSELLTLASGAVAGDPQAWRALWCRLEPLVWGLTGKWQVMGPLCKLHEDRRNVVLAVMQRLRQADFRRLRTFLAGSPYRDDRVFRAWIATVAARVAVDYSRAHPEHIDPRGRHGGERWVKVVPLSEHAQSSGLDPARKAQALRVLEHARSELGADQLVALAAWLEGHDATAIAGRLGLDDAAAAQRVLRSALKRLRDHFRQREELAAVEESR